MQNLHASFMAFGLIVVPLEVAAAEDLLLGFELGSTVEQAQKHALSNSWKLVRSHEKAPREWYIEGAKAGLYVCDNRVLAVRRQFEGSVDEFAALVMHTTIKQGDPKTQIVTFMTGSVRISNIDVRYEASDGSGTLIQLSSIGGEIGISTNVWSKFRCEDANE